MGSRFVETTPCCPKCGNSKSLRFDAEENTKVCLRCGYRRHVITGKPLNDYASKESKEIASFKAELREVRGALAGLELFWNRDGENANDAFERIGEIFYSETGYLRPGKSYPVSCPEPPDRRDVWEKWCATKVEIARDFLDRTASAEGSEA